MILLESKKYNKGLYNFLKIIFLLYNLILNFKMSCRFKTSVHLLLLIKRKFNNGLILKGGESMRQI